MDQFQQAQFQVEALLLPVIQIVKSAQYDLQIARQFFFAEQQGGTRGPRALVTRNLQQLGLLAVELRHQRIAKIAHHLARQRRRTMPRVQKLVELLHQRSAFTCGNSFKQALKYRIGNGAHQFANLRRRQHSPSTLERSRRDCLVHDAERIPHRAVPGLGEQRKRSILSLDVFLRGDHLQLRENVIELDGVKAEVLAPGANRLWNIFWLSRCHHENDVRRRLFQRLEQRVESGFGNLVSLVENVNLVAIARRRIARGIAQLANLINAAIRGRVNLDHIDRVALANFDAGIAYATRLRRGTFRRPDCVAAVQRHGHDARNGGFSDPAMA